MSEERFGYERVDWLNGLPHLTTLRLLLRVAEPADTPALAEFLRNEREHFRPWFPTSALEPTPSQLTRMMEERKIQALEDRGYRFHLFSKQSPNTIVGLCSIADVRRGAIQQGVLGYGLGHEWQGNGLMTEAVRAAVAFAFDDLDLHRLEGSYIPSNKRSEAILNKLGFVQEGFFKKYLLLGGAWQDHIVTSLVNPAWRGVGRTTQSRAADSPAT